MQDTNTQSNMMTAQDFANKVREKYPDGISSDGRKYADIPDNELAQKIIDKYPVYKDQVQMQQQTSFGDKVKSALGTAADVGIGAAKGLANTAQTVAKPITNVMNEVLPHSAEGFSQQELTPTNTAQSVGKTGEQIAEFAAPGTAGLKAAKGAGLLTKIGTEALSSGLVNTAQTGTTAGAAEGAGIGAVSPILGKTLSFLTKGVTKNIAGGLAKGTNILENVLDNPKAALEGLNMPQEQVFSKDIGLVKDAVTNTYKNAKEAYAAGLSKLDEAIPEVDPTKAEVPIKSALDKFGIKLNGNFLNGFIVDTSESPLSDAEKSVVQKVIDLVSKSEARTPTQVDALAQKVAKFERPGPDAMQVNSVIRGIKNGLRQSIIESAPEDVKDVAQNIASNYAKSMDKLDLYQKLFKVSKDPILSETERANATQKLKNLFSGEKPVEERTLKELGLEDILARQAGRVSGAESISRSQTGLGDLLKTAVNVVLTPKTVTKIAAYTKLGSDAISNIFHKSKTVEDFINNLPRGVQGSALQFLHDEQNQPEE